MRASIWSKASLMPGLKFMLDDVQAVWAEAVWAVPDNPQMATSA